jgi:HAD superfamily hydrolase (TIGR01509 family)
MDGTIVDTEPYWMAAETQLVTAHGGTWSEDDGLSLVGSGLWHSARVLQAHGVDLTEDEIIQSLTSMVLAQIEVEVPWRPGALAMLEAIGASGMRSALVTMSIRRMAERVAEALPPGTFDAIVAGDDVTHSKPHPEPYLMGAAHLGVAAADCVAIEDSAPGVASAVASGAVVIAIPFHGEAPVGDHTVWTTLEGRTLDDLRAVYRSERA